jgi:hypothetical protein
MTQHVIERLCGAQPRRLFRDRNSEDPNLVVVWQRERLRVGGSLDGVGEKIGVLIRLIQPIGSVVMRRIPRYVGGFYEALGEGARRSRACMSAVPEVDFGEVLRSCECRLRDAVLSLGKRAL